MIALEFWYSDHDSLDADDTLEIVREMDRAEEKLNLEDWRHLYRFSGNNPCRVLIRERIEELSWE